jgi:predicted cytidylate kinase
MVVVTFSGLHGAGKSTFAKEIAEEFGLRYVSAGDLFRLIARERDLTVIELTDLAVKDSSIDKQMDDITRREAENGSVVLDGQLAGWMAGELADIRIYLKASWRRQEGSCYIVRQLKGKGISRSMALMSVTPRYTRSYWIQASSARSR